MVRRLLWIELVEKAWTERTILWLAGIRRAGKTVLCKSLDTIEYFDCETPRDRRKMDDPQDFLDGMRGKRIVLDEVHHLPNPSELLKIAADHYPDVHITATGSSTLWASAKFRDTLAGRKKDLFLTPMVWRDLEDFKQTGIKHRLLHGGLPPFFLAATPKDSDFREWMDAYWARDIVELFRIERRDSFMRFLELLFAQSGGIFEATRFARACGVSSPTIATYLGMLQSTFVANVIRPFSTYKPSEIVAAPKVYGFDTGFVCYFKGWSSVRQEDLGILWEHLVLNELQFVLQSQPVQYWRDKHGHEVDFILSRRGKGPVAVECKWSCDDFNAANLKSFRERYPGDDNFIVVQNIDKPYSRTFGKVKARFIGLKHIQGLLKG